MSTEKLVSNFLSLNTREWLKGLKVTVVGAVFGYFTSLYQMPNFNVEALYKALLDWKYVLGLAVFAAGSYIVTTGLSGSKAVKKDLKE